MFIAKLVHDMEASGRGRLIAGVGEEDWMVVEKAFVPACNKGSIDTLAGECVRHLFLPCRMINIYKNRFLLSLSLSNEFWSKRVSWIFIFGR